MEFINTGITFTAIVSFGLINLIHLCAFKRLNSSVICFLIELTTRLYLTFNILFRSSSSVPCQPFMILSECYLFVSVMLIWVYLIGGEIDTKVKCAGYMGVVFMYTLVLFIYMKSDRVLGSAVNVCDKYQNVSSPILLGFLVVTCMTAISTRVLASYTAAISIMFFLMLVLIVLELYNGMIRSRDNVQTQLIIEWIDMILFIIMYVFHFDRRYHGHYVNQQQGRRGQLQHRQGGSTRFSSSSSEAVIEDV